MKALRTLILFVLVIGLVAFGAASLWLGKGVKAAVEKFGPGIIGAPVTIDAVVLTPWSGKGMVKGLVIGNPPGFKGPYAVKVGAVELSLKLSSLTSDVIVVKRLAVKDPELAYEIGSAGSNVGKLQKNAEAASGGPSKSAPSSGPSKSLLIEELSITGGQVGVAAGPLGGAKVPLPAVELHNLGGKGKTAAQTVAEALGGLTGAAQKAVSNIGGKALDAAASQVIGRLGGFLKGKR